MTAYYNENDRFAAQWLKNLIGAGHIADGDVDTRSIEEVSPDDLRGYTQCHFFAGIGGWSLALRLAGWPEDRPVWTGSCPCQPFSSIGKRKGFSDERHLWPNWLKLIKRLRPPVLFGEQVAAKDALPWVDGVQNDLEGEGYAFWPVDLCAPSVGAPHIRQRLYWVGDSDDNRRAWRGALPSRGKGVAGAGAGGFRTSGMGHAVGAGLEGQSGHGHDKTGRQVEGRPARSAGVPLVGVGDANGSGREGKSRVQRGRPTDAPAGAWSDAIWWPCKDGKWRPVSPDPSAFPLSHGFPSRVGRLRAYGNAIVPQVAAQVIKAYMEVVG